VAIDPDMLGKAFENLLEVKERKSKGSFYTPREIVHYMCQESLINYLDTAVNSLSEIIGVEKQKQAEFTDEKAERILTATVRMELGSRADIETFIRSGDQASYYEAARVEGTSYRSKLPKTIETHARLLDDKLADITVCDPAIGSGAFPVGMMQEIVRARSALTPYFNDVRERTSYHFKRHAIQNCLYGVHIDPGAAEIAKLRLWLSLV
jgi:type II restriction/modification system DNA methylase subunit YeeA